MNTKLRWGRGWEVSWVILIAAATACQTSTVPSSPPPTADAAGAPGTGVSSSGAPEASLAPVLADLATELPSLRLRLTALRRRAINVVELQVLLVNDSSEVVHLGPLLASGSWLGESSLSDPDGHRRFFVMRDSDGAVAASEPPLSLEPAGTVALSARFGAVPAELSVVDFSVRGVAPVRALPIQP